MVAMLTKLYHQGQIDNFTS